MGRVIFTLLAGGLIEERAGKPGHRGAFVFMCADAIRA